MLKLCVSIQGDHQLEENMVQQSLNQIGEDLLVTVEKHLALEMIVDESLMIENESLEMLMDETLKVDEYLLHTVIADC
ncbi:hypothetical protein Tco_1074841 [Tanacetum coccineum]